MNRLSPRASGQTAPLLLHILALTVLTRRAAVRIALTAAAERGKTGSVVIICGQTWGGGGR